jgi:hypothetical protein
VNSPLVKWPGTLVFSGGSCPTFITIIAKMIVQGEAEAAVVVAHM